MIDKGLGLRFTDPRAGTNHQYIVCQMHPRRSLPVLLATVMTRAPAYSRGPPGTYQAHEG